jgi:hypothetical protein
MAVLKPIKKNTKESGIFEDTGRNQKTSNIFDMKAHSTINSTTVSSAIHHVSSQPLKGIKDLKNNQLLR